jgi:hypothetical protein|tara:strand:- start:2650 stop:4212 length:1563 start_codon:yes stop_codon:yes gene_type:complete
MTSADNYIQFSFDPYDWVSEGIKIADDNNLTKPSSEQSVTRNREIVRGANKTGYKPNDSRSFDEQFDLNTGLSTFLDQELLEAVEDNVQDINSELDLGGDLSPSKLKFTSRAIGVFDFSQASNGLIRPVEYYSELEKKVIDSSDVFQSSLGSVDYNYYNLDDKEVVVQKRQKGTTEMVENCPELKVLNDAKSSLFLPFLNGKIVTECKGFRLKFSTTNKKVYAIREKKGGGIAPYVDLYFTSGENFQMNPEQMLISMMPNLMLARVLERSGVRVRIFCMFPQNIGGEWLLKIFMIKNYGETTDINKISTFTSDTRFFRYWMWNASAGWNFKMTNGSRNYGGSEGSMIPHGKIETVGMPYIRNFVADKIDRGEFPSQVVDKRLMIFSGLRASEDQSLTSDDTKLQIANSFKKASDYVQIQLSKTPNKVIKEIIKKRKADGESDYKISTYLNGVITQAMSTTSQIRTQSLSEIDEELRSGIIDKNEYFNKYRTQVQRDTQEYQNEIIEERNKYLQMVENNLK